MGGSYGGYATLAGLAFSPEAFTCGVDIVGPSNLNTLLKTIPPYWSTILSTFHERMGDWEEMLTAQSPLFKADQIKAPLLIGQGANDPREQGRERPDRRRHAQKTKTWSITCSLMKATDLRGTIWRSYPGGLEHRRCQ